MRAVIFRKGFQTWLHPEFTKLAYHAVPRGDYDYGSFENSSWLSHAYSLPDGEGWKPGDEVLRAGARRERDDAVCRSGGPNHACRDENRRFALHALGRVC